MIKTLKITSIAAAILAVILFVLPVVFGVRSDPKIEEFLRSPGAAGKLLASKDRRPVRNESQTSPLIKQAADFARYLNPPPLPPPPRSTARNTSREVRPAPPAVTPKFKLIGTSFYATRPELSLALIDEPGKGFNWVRQGNSVGHLTIEQIKNGSITIRDGQGTSEMTVTVDQPWRKLLKNPPPGTQPAPPDAGQIGPTDIGPVPSGSAAPAPVVRGRPGFITRAPRRGTVQSASSKVSEPMTPVPAYEPSPLEKEKQAQIDRLMAEIGDNRITDDEAAKLDELTKLVEELGEIRAEGYEAQLNNKADINSPPQTNR